MNLLPYQQEIYTKLTQEPRYGLFLEMGFGKTAIMLHLISYLRSKGLRSLVIAPPHVAQLVWTTEATKFTPHLTYTLIPPGYTASRRTKIAQENQENPSDFTLLSTTMVHWYFSGAQYHRDYQVLIVDESTKFKSYKSKTFKSLAKYLSNFTHRYIMTGTPIPNGYEDLWSQIYLLDNGQRLGENITAYRSRYFTKHSYNLYRYYLLPNAEDSIKKAISDITLSRSLEGSNITLPPLVSEVLYLDMPSAILKDYKRLKKEFILEYKKTPLTYEPGDDDTIRIVAPTQATLTNKLLQYCSGAIYITQTQYHVLHNLKIELFQEVLNNFPSRILLAYNYLHEAERLQASYPTEVTRYDGKPETILKWQQGSLPRVLMAHPQSIAHGLNLQTSSNVIVWFGFTWNLELYQQFNKRLHRRGQSETTYLIHLAVGSIEYRLMEKLKEKDLTQQGLMKYLEEVARPSPQDTFLC